MPSLLSLPVASSPGATDKLWLTQGTGTGRDKQVEAGALIAGALPAVVAGFSAPSALTGAETVPLLQSAAMKEMPISDVVRAYNLDPTLITLAKYNNGADATLDAMKVGTPTVRVAYSPGARAIFVDVLMTLSGRSASASNANAITVDMAAAITAGLPADLAAALAGQSRYMVISSFQTAALVPRTHVGAALGTAPGFLSVGAIPWSTIAPVNSENLVLAVNYSILVP